jgi:FAD/FMN-containing dehydrogenase
VDRRHFLQIGGGGLAALLAGCGGGGSSSPPPPPPPPGGGLVSGGTDFGPLASRLQGSVMVPTTTGYDSVRLLANTLYDDIRPTAIVRCASAADVQAALAFVQDKGLHVTARCGGHSWAGYSTTTGVVLNVNAMNSVTANGDGTATVGAGARLAEVYTGLIAQGVCIPSGTCPTVGIAGITMGGGIGVLDRQFGLTCDTLVSADVVTVDGRLLTCSATSEPDLFWALRGGGGGNFGIATSFTFRTHPTQDITVARASFAMHDFAAVFQAWQAWPQTLPDSIWAQVYVNIWQGSATFTVTAWCLGTVADMTPHWNAFLSAAGAMPATGGGLDPSVVQQRYGDVALAFCGSDTLAQCSLQDVTTAGAVQRYAEVLSSDYFAAGVPDAGIQVLIDRATALAQSGGAGSYIFDHMGGALGRVAADATAFPHRDALFSLEYGVSRIGGFAYDPTWPNAMRGAMSAWSTGGAYVNYLDPLLADWSSAYYGANYARLQQVKKTYDPNRVLSMPQGIVPAP